MKKIVGLIVSASMVMSMITCAFAEETVMVAGEGSSISMEEDYVIEEYDESAITENDSIQEEYTLSDIDDEDVATDDNTYEIVCPANVDIEETDDADVTTILNAMEDEVITDEVDALEEIDAFTEEISAEDLEEIASDDNGAAVKDNIFEDGQAEDEVISVNGGYITANPMYSDGSDMEDYELAVPDGDTAQYTTITVQFKQEDVRKMAKMVNDFRTGSDAWQYDTSGNKVYKRGLSELKYDYNLEKVAMLRAAELAYNLVYRNRFEHDRPNGYRCFSAHSDAKYGYYAAGENIAYGYTNNEWVFTAWREDNYGYSGQGHRRNMLSENFDRFAIAHCVYNGRDYWVQEFAGAWSDDMGTSSWGKSVDKADVRIYTSGSGDLYIKKILLGWVKNSTGWKYYYVKNKCVKSDWYQIDGKWYRFNSSGYMLKGWQKVGTKWYLLDYGNGVMRTGWYKGASGIWYYMNSNGVMQTGWQKIDGTYYYFNSKGEMKKGWIKVGTKKYYMNTTNGKLTTGWKMISKKWYYFNVNGVMQTGWINLGGKYYYLYSDGHMAASEWIGNYHVNEKGAWDRSR